MKILNICSVPITYHGGSEKVILELSKRLAKNNDVTILQTNLYEEKEKIEKYSKFGKIKIITCKNDAFLGGYGYSKDFKRTLKKIWKDYDIIHIYGHGRFTSNFTIKFLHHKKPLLFSAHGFFHNKKHKIFKKIYDSIFGRLLKKIDYCIALTKIEKKQYISLGVKEEKIKILPGGVELKGYKKKDLKRLKEKYFGGESNKPNMLYVGRILESKGLSYIIKAIKNIDIKFLIVGKDAGYMPKLKELIKKEGVEEKVKFLGSVSNKELEEIYSIIDFFILFSSWEGFGLVVIEAMNAKKPVIVSDRGSLPTIVEEGKTGFIVKYPNVKKLEEKIKLLAKNKKLREEMGKKAEIFSRKFDWNVIAEEHLKLYRTLNEN